MKIQVCGREGAVVDIGFVLFVFTGFTHLAGETTASALWDITPFFESQSVQMDLLSFQTPVVRVGMCAVLAKKTFCEVPW